MSSTKQGLSPHLRGNHQQSARQSANRGSIPALAGEPLLGRRLVPARWVYPRTCGGTKVLAAKMRVWAGLSPHLRGNRLPSLLVDHAQGSIPALAGEPES